MTDRAHVRVACALIERGAHVLVAQRAAGKVRAGMWELPGGKLAAGETTESAIVREIAEELGCIVRPIELLPRHTHAYPDLTVTLLPVRCALVRGEPAPLEHAQIRWLRIDELASIAWSAADIVVVEDYVKTSAPRI